MTKINQSGFLLCFSYHHDSNLGWQIVNPDTDEIGGTEGVKNIQQPQ